MIEVKDYKKAGVYIVFSVILLIFIADFTIFKNVVFMKLK